MELTRLHKTNNYFKQIMCGHQNIHHLASSRVPNILDIEALILQFKRLANVYFLIIAILQTIPEISPLSPATAWVPFIVVLGISMLR